MQTSEDVYKDEALYSITSQQVAAWGGPTVEPLDQELYYFPETSIGGERSWTATDSMTRAQERDEADAASFGDAVVVFVSVSSIGMADLASMSQLTSGSSTLSGMQLGSGGSSDNLDKTKGKLEAELERMVGAIKIPEKISEKAYSKSGCSMKVQDTRSHLVTLREEVETLRGEVRFCSSSRKQKNEPFSETLANQYNRKLKDCSAKIVEDCKVLRALESPERGR